MMSLSDDVDKPRGYHAEWNMSKKDKYRDFLYMSNLKNKTNEQTGDNQKREKDS